MASHSCLYAYPSAPAVTKMVGRLISNVKVKKTIPANVKMYTKSVVCLENTGENRKVMAQGPWVLR